MARRIIRKEVKKQILDDNQLAADFCDQIGCKIVSLPSLLSNNRKIVTDTDAISWLSERLHKSNDEILIEATDIDMSKNRAQKAVP